MNYVNVSGGGEIMASSFFGLIPAALSLINGFAIILAYATFLNFQEGRLPRLEKYFAPVRLCGRGKCFAQVSKMTINVCRPIVFVNFFRQVREGVSIIGQNIAFLVLSEKNRPESLI